MTIKAEVELRGTPATPFGFVYVGKTRIGFSADRGIWFTDRGTPTPAELAAAVRALAEYEWAVAIPGVRHLREGDDE